MKNIWITPADGTWVVRAGGAVIGESANALELAEGDREPVIYFPREDIGMAFLERSQHTSVSADLGEASYFNIVAKSGLIHDAGWSFEAPTPEAARIAGYIAFQPNKVTLELV